jgi:dipeptidyl aminopeptidase/acylaminoacyl peptidase
MTDTTRSVTAADFADLAAFNTLPRVGSIALSPDGSRLVAVVSELAPDGKTWQGALWEIDPNGSRSPRRLTSSAKGESSPAFTPDGSVLFLSSRPDQQSADKDKQGKDKTALWLLPPTGEARELHRPAGGVEAFRVAKDAGTLLLSATAHTTTAFGEEDAAKRKTREDSGITAILHESYPIRFWDSDVGPAYRRVLTTGPVTADSGRIDGADLTDLAPEAGSKIEEIIAISPDGQWVLYSEHVPVSPSYGDRYNLVIAAADGSSTRVLADEPGHSFGHAAFTPDSATVVAVRNVDSTADSPWTSTLVRIDAASGEITDLLPDFTEEPSSPVVSPTGDAVFFTSSDHGHQPIWRLDLASGAVTRLTAGGAYTDVIVSPDGTALYAMGGAIDHAPTPVRLAASGVDQTPVRLAAPGLVDSLPGTLTEVETTVADGRTVRAWLVLPEGASADSPAPLLLWVHGGPVMSWNNWSWRWNPWLMAARGYAVLLPDPALSTGYGHDFVKAGWGRWGAEPYTDLMAITDVTEQRADIDESRTAAMGGSFGGYMANWIAGQTDRFRAIVTHASLWHLDAFTGSTDGPYYWIREMGDPLTRPERMLANSPHLNVGNIKTPMLVIHGDKDYRVPIGEGQRLYFDLVRHGVNAKFLYYPTENHWILTPGNSRIWYETVFAFLAEHVHDEAWERPELL